MARHMVGQQSLKQRLNAHNLICEVYIRSDKAVHGSQVMPALLGAGGR